MKKKNAEPTRVYDTKDVFGLLCGKDKKRHHSRWQYKQIPSNPK